MARAHKGKLEPFLREGKVIFFDGAMGTMLQSEGITGYSCPEELNLVNPGLIEKIHSSYVRAGAQVIETNTFSANKIKLSKINLESRLEKIIKAGVEIARKAAGKRALVAGSIGPLGDFIEPVGSISPAEALVTFKKTAEIFRRAEVDLIIIETMSDLKEARTACLAASASGLPFIITMTFEEDGRTVLGTPPEAAAITLSNLGPAMIGVNCSLGPENLLPTVRRMASLARCPLIVQPNAGLPKLVNGKTVFPTGPEQFAEEMESFLKAGVTGMGGCCGTTPDHISSLTKHLRGRRAALIELTPGCHLASRSGYTLIGPHYPVAVIGERVNPTGRKRLAAEMKQGDMSTVRREIVNQVQAGATLLDLNAGAAGVNETEILPRILEQAQKIVNVPLVIDSTNPAALEASLSVLEGRALINSVNASKRSIESILPLAASFGAAVIGLTMDERGIPEDESGRLRLAEKIVSSALNYGLDASDVLIDCLAVAAGSDQLQVMETLRTLQSLRNSVHTGSVLGVSNVSYGLPAREELNASFVSMAVYCGLDAAIANPYSKRIMDALASSMVLKGRDAGASSFLKKYSPDRNEGTGPSSITPKREKGKITQAVLEGDVEQLIKLVRQELEKDINPILINEKYLIPALEKVGELFEKKVYFLPQVIASAEAVRGAFDFMKDKINKSDEGGTVRILLATVEGDIHDLGKNILKALLENYGYVIEDLGINVPPAVIAEKVKSEDIKLVGLSALMTTTLPSMEETLRLIKKNNPSVPVIVGGAVLTEEYAIGIGADGYAPDAPAAVKLVKKILSP